MNNKKIKDTREKKNEQHSRILFKKKESLTIKIPEKKKTKRKF